MYKPQVQENPMANLIVDTFYGYNHTPKIYDGQFYRQDNMSSRDFPLLSTRRLQGYVDEFETHSYGMIRHHIVVHGTVRECICAVNDSYISYYYIEGNQIKKVSYSATFQPTPKQLVTSGAYIYIFPDKVRINMATPDTIEPLEAVNTATTFEVMPCWEDGTYFHANYTGVDEPQSPTDGYIWCDTHDGNTAWKQWYAGTSEEDAHWIWLNLDDIHVKVSYVGLGANVKAGDTVNFIGAKLITAANTVKRIGGATPSGEEIELLTALEGYHKVVGADQGNVWFEGNVRSRYLVTMTGEDSFTVSRTCPDMDYVCECNNRLWGCKFGFVDGKIVNELYCSQLGDPTNWHAFNGLSTASWAASCGTDGPWTGCISYNGYPYFFKKDSITRVYISSTGAHQTNDYPYPGVQNGCWDSLRVVSGLLYYKGDEGIYAFDGGYPSMISEVLGNVRYSDARAGSAYGTYHVCMREETGLWKTFTYDTKCGVWSVYAIHGETDWIDYFETLDGVLFIGNSHGELICEDGNRYGLQKEKPFDWFVESGLQYYGFNVSKSYANRYPAVNWYCSCFNFRVRMAPGAVCRLYIEYDSSGEWELQGEFRSDRLSTQVIPVPQRRCDHLRFKLEGIGEMQLWMIARKQEGGSDE